MSLQERIFKRAQHYVGAVSEIPGEADHPLILWWHSLCGIDDQPGQATDEIPWCSSFVNGVCWDEDAPMTRSARARSWLTIGSPISLAEAVRGDIAVIKRGPDILKEPGPEVIKHRGHVFVLAGVGGVGRRMEGVGGNQGNKVSVASFPLAALLSIRRF